MNRLGKYRVVLIIVLITELLFTGFFYIYQVDAGIPDSIKIYVGDDSSFDFSMPVEANLEGSVEALNISNAKKKGDGKIHFSMQQPFTVTSSEKGRYKMNLKLFGIFNLKSISLDVIDNLELIPCGNTIGIQVKTDGLLVLGTGAVLSEDGLDYEPAYQILQTGDYITSIDGNKVSSIKKLERYLNSNTDGYVTLGIRRNGKESSVKLQTVECQDGTTKIGVWVREDTQGIGTLTYMSGDGQFGALGHGITDSDTGVLMEIKSGKLYNTEIIKIIKGSSGNPGEIMGMILESDSELIGTVEENSELGIRGTISEKADLSKYRYGSIPVGLRQEIKKGPAVILCQIGDEIEEYNIKIVDIDKGSTDNKGIVLQINDDRLLKKTGGIIQGMSGAPIIQNGKLIGAVTHVFVQDSTKGYGIFIENMLEK